MKYLYDFGYFWYDFIVGDAWEVAVGVVITMGAMGFLLSRVQQEDPLRETLGPVLAVALILITASSLWYERRGRRF